MKQFVDVFVDDVEVWRVCSITNQKYLVCVPLAQFNAWRNGALIQDAMSELTAEQREFLISNTTPSEWNEMFPEE